MNNDKTHQDMELRALIETCYDDETKILEKEKILVLVMTKYYFEAGIRFPYFSNNSLVFKVENRKVGGPQP